LKKPPIVAKCKQNVSKSFSAAKANKSISKATVKSNIDKWYTLAWNYNPKKNRDKSVTEKPSNVTAPKWLANYTGDKKYAVKNIPYCWGGWNAQTFKEKISGGSFAGNVNTSNKFQVSGTVGMDCSGFVSVVYDLSRKYGTGELNQCFKKVDKVAAYDIMNKAGDHVIIVTKVYTSDGKKYLDTVEESKSSGKIVKKSKVAYKTLTNEGYIPMSYNNLN